MPPKLADMLKDIVLGISDKSLGFKDLEVIEKGNGPVLLLPGFLTSHRSLKYLHSFFEESGYSVFTYKDCVETHKGFFKNFNMGWSQSVRESIKEKAIQLKEYYGKPPIVVGWSLGGVYALNIFKEDNDLFKKVFTLASPLSKPFSKNSPWLMKSLYSAITKNLKGLDAVVSENSKVVDNDKVIVIGAKKDGLVSCEACVSSCLKSYVVDAYHMNVMTSDETIEIIKSNVKN